MASNLELTIKRAEWLENVANDLVQDTILPVAEYRGINGAHRYMSYRIATAPISSRSNIKVLGNCKNRAYDIADMTNEIIIDSSLGELDSYLVVQVLLHELIHAFDDCESGHGKRFFKMASSCGFEPPFKVLKASESLEVLAEKLVEKWGFLPHSGTKEVQKSKSKKARSKKLLCINCDFQARVSALWMDKINFSNAFCPVCHFTGTLEERV